MGLYKNGIQRIVGVFMWLYNKAIGVFTAVKDFVVDAFKWIVKKISNAIMQ
ncbi:hypothetical protein E5F92_009200 [Flavobacterium columnare]|uniref:hypothetical protein n=1 Tax=Flavobacterium columnare TaxID=996 RepID=UPI002989DEB8|nr:hypothetical protein [Flavobacterium columnare]MCH4832840.1 hypothetical protein [Flavobacterium columnare]